MYKIIGFFQTVLGFCWYELQCRNDAVEECFFCEYWWSFAIPNSPCKDSVCVCVLVFSDMTCPYLFCNYSPGYSVPELLVYRMTPLVTRRNHLSLPRRKRTSHRVILFSKSIHIIHLLYSSYLYFYRHRSVQRVDLVLII